MIAVQNVSVRRGGRALVSDVGFEVSGGEVVALVGPNGAGKSTLLKVMAADMQPTHGDVTIHGESLRGLTAVALARTRAVLPQHATLDFDFQVHEVVAMGCAPWSGATTEAAGNGAAGNERSIVQAALALVGMESFTARAYPSLSGGEQQRVHLARVLAQLWPRPGAAAQSRGVMLLDEPVASLDPQHQHRTLQIARAVAAQGHAVLVVLHDLNLAVQYADRIALLCGGQLRTIGPAHSTLSGELLSDVYATPFDVVRHPCADCPLVVARPVVSRE